MEEWHIKPRIGRRLDAVPRSLGLQLEVRLWEARVGVMRARRMQVRRLRLMWVWRGLIGIWRPSAVPLGQARAGRTVECSRRLPASTSHRAAQIEHGPCKPKLVAKQRCPPCAVCTWRPTHGAIGTPGGGRGSRASCDVKVRSA